VVITAQAALSERSPFLVGPPPLKKVDEASVVHGLGLLALKPFELGSNLSLIPPCLPARRDERGLDQTLAAPPLDRARRNPEPPG